MKKLRKMAWTLRLWKDTRGQDMIEYALIAGFIAIAATAIVPQVGTAIVTLFTNVNTKLTAAGSAGS
jgi:pilus assembly protein Flp/PilA